MLHVIKIIDCSANAQYIDWIYIFSYNKYVKCLLYSLKNTICNITALTSRLQLFCRRVHDIQVEVSLVWKSFPSSCHVSIRPDAGQWAGPRQWVTAPASCICFRPFAPVCTASSDAAELTPSLPHPFLIISISTHTGTHTPRLSFLCVSVCILHFYSLSSKLTEVGKLPSAGASSRCSLFLSSPHLCLSPPPFLSLSRGAYSALSVPVRFFFSPSTLVHCLLAVEAQRCSCMRLCITIATGKDGCIVGCF